MHLYKNMAFSIMLHLFISILCFSFLILFSNTMHELFLIISISLFVLTLISIIYSFYSWNVKIFFDSEKISYKQKGKTYIWRWVDITDCKIKLRFTASRNPLSYCFEITTIKDEKKLIFEYSSKREKFLLEVCPLENVKAIFKKAFNK